MFTAIVILLSKYPSSIASFNSTDGTLIVWLQLNVV